MPIWMAPNATRGRRAVTRVAMVIAIVLCSTGAGAMKSDAQVRRPVLGLDFPDPDLVRDGASWYLFSTNASNVGNVPVARSANLDSWQVVGDALPSLGDWASAGFTWAPAVVHLGSGWTLFYTANDTSSGRQCIGHAVATKPTGPYVDDATAPMVCQLDHGGSIDPDVYRDHSGNWWLTWKSDDNAVGNPTHIWSQRLSSDGTALIGSPRLLLTADQPWEDSIIEGPSMIDRGGQVLLFYGAAWWESWSASIGYAVCQSAAGPCSKPDSPDPWMSSGGAVAAGPQGPSLTTSDNGTTVLAFTQWTYAVGYAQGGQRQPSIEPLDTSQLPPQWRSDRPRAGPIQPDLLWLVRHGLSPGGADDRVEFGAAYDIPVTGDWDASTTTDLGVYENGMWYLRDSLTPGPPDHTIHYGSPWSTPVTGDWDGNGTTDIGTYENGWWYLRDSLTPGSPDHTISYGTQGYWPRPGTWTSGGAGVATVMQH
jgi:hypothetical protein